MCKINGWKRLRAAQKPCNSFFAPISLHCSDTQHRHEMNKYVVDLLVAMLETSHCIIPLTKPRPKRGVKDIPGWK